MKTKINIALMLIVASFSFTACVEENVLPKEKVTLKKTNSTQGVEHNLPREIQK